MRSTVKMAMYIVSRKTSNNNRASAPKPVAPKPIINNKPKQNTGNKRVSFSDTTKPPAKKPIKRSGGCGCGR